MISWTIAPLVDSDCEELGRVHMAVWREGYAGLLPEEYLASLDDEQCARRWHERAGRPADPSTTLVARDAAGILGFISAGPSRDADAPTPWELKAINVLRRGYGSGVADALLREGVGDRAATLWVLEENHRARRFYTRHGFVDEGGRKLLAETGTPEIRMIRRGPATP